MPVICVGNENMLVAVWMFCVSRLSVLAKQHTCSVFAVLHRSLFCNDGIHVWTHKGAGGNSSVARQSTACFGKARHLW